MRLSISETAALSGVSVRTLHYYDEIGLLKPQSVTDAGYRYYGDEQLRTLQEIMFLRELDFPLKDIESILCQKQHDREKSLRRQRELLLLKRERLDRLIALLDETAGEKTSFKEFDMSEIENAKAEYAKEVKERWGATDAYAQSEAKAKNRTKADWDVMNDKMNALIREFAANRSEAPDSAKAHELVGNWQKFLCDNYYDCPNEMLGSLAEMYVGDERFKKNIDSNGEGTAQFMHDAIAAYCKK